jgi:histidyl-tRNA synthetase
MNTEITKGFKDYVGEEAEKRAEIKKILIETFEKYGFEPAETPVIENEEFVKGENEKDEAVSDIFKLQDKGKRKLALRYEFTFQLKRIAKNKKLPYKRYEIGPVFRDEPVQGNRGRQFIACDADIIGISEIPSRDEAEILNLVNNLLKILGIEFTILVNNRKLLNEILDDLKIKEKNREEVIKELDKIDKIDVQTVQNNLNKLGAGRLLECLSQGEEYFEKFESYKEIISLVEYCKIYGFSVKFAPSLARGLGYYTGTIFEVKSNIRESICGGGSYIFNGVKCFGFGTGLERLAVLSKLKIEKEKYLIVSLDEDEQAIKIAEKLRKKNKIVSLFYGKPTKALEYANSYKINSVIFVGEKEVKGKKFKVKDMKSGKENLLKI